MTPPAAALPARIAAHPLAALGATGASNVGIAAFTLLNGILIARLLGPEGRGSLFAMVAFPTAAAALVGSFAHNAIARRSARGRETRGRLNGLVLQATLLPAAATALASVALVAIGGAQLEAAETRAALAYAVAWAPAAVGLLNFQAVDMGAQRWSRYNLLRLMPYPVILAGVAACMATGTRDAAAMLAVLLLSTAAPLAVRVGLALRDGGFERVPGAEVRALHREAVPFAAAGAGAAALAHADQLVAAAALAPATAGIYAVAQRAGLLLAPLASAAGVIAFSHSARAGGGHAPGGRAYPAVLAAAAVVLAPAIWLLVPVLYGPEFAPARLPAVIALGAGLVAATAERREQHVEGGGDPLRVVPGRVAGALAVAAAAVVFGLRHGAAGIALASVLGQTVRASVSLALSPRRA
jgi:O-antigen/teichoic acid export membrane protein